MPLANNVLEDSAIDQLAPVLQGFRSVVNQTNRQQPVHQLASRKRLFVQVPPEIKQFVVHLEGKNNNIGKCFIYFLKKVKNT